MKRVNLISGVILSAALAGCGGNEQTAGNIITVDVNTEYPEKELILQDFMDVEYVPLETSDEFITRGIVQTVGKNMLLVTNRKDGDIFIFDRTGKGIRKINRLGQSGEEYTQVTGIVLDEDSNEMFVIDNPLRKILVFDLDGKFLRSFRFADTSYYRSVFNYDKDHLICFKAYPPLDENEQSCHLLVSKQDGSIVREVRIPVKQFKTPIVTKGDVTVTPGFFRLTSFHDEWILTRTSSDTIYTYLPGGDLVPLIVRTPSINSMNVEVFLFPTIITDRYYFMRTLDKEFNFEKMKGFSTADLMYDKLENAVFRYTVYNDDFTYKNQFSWGQIPEIPDDPLVAAFRPLEAPDLVEAYGKGELKGRLKEIAAGLNEESNPVIMLVKRKK